MSKVIFFVTLSHSMNHHWKKMVKNWSQKINPKWSKSSPLSMRICVKSYLCCDSPQSMKQLTPFTRQMIVSNTFAICQEKISNNFWSTLKLLPFSVVLNHSIVTRMIKISVGYVHTECPKIVWYRVLQNIQLMRKCTSYFLGEKWIFRWPKIGWIYFQSS